MRIIEGVAIITYYFNLVFIAMSFAFIATLIYGVFFNYYAPSLLFITEKWGGVISLNSVMGTLCLLRSFNRPKTVFIQ